MKCGDIYVGKLMNRGYKHYSEQVQSKLVEFYFILECKQKANTEGAYGLLVKYLSANAR